MHLSHARPDNDKNREGVITMTADTPIASEFASDFASEFERHNGAAAYVARVVACAAEPVLLVEAFGGPQNYKALLASVERMDRRISGSIREHMITATGPQACADVPKSLCDIDAKWAEGERPSMPALAAAWIDHLGIPRDSRRAGVIIMTALRAEMVQGHAPKSAAVQADEPAYHNRMHTAEVFQGACFLIDAQRGNDAFSSFYKSMIMVAALAHDLEHPGKGNPKGELCANEDMSADFLDPLIEGVYGRHHPLAVKGMKMTRIMIRLTDPGEPHKIMRRAMEARDLPYEKRHAHLYKSADQAAMCGHRSANSRIWDMAAILCDADLMMSAASGPEGQLRQSQRLTREAGQAGMAIDFCTPAAKTYFYNEIFGGSFLSGVARATLKDAPEKTFGPMPALAPGR